VTRFRKSRVVGAAVLAVLALAGVALFSALSDGGNDSGLPLMGVVPDDVPDHRLVQDALDLDAWRSQQPVANFTALPASRPPDLARMLIGGGGEAVLDTYHAVSGIVAVVAFSEQSLSLCDEADSGIVCLREEKLTDSLLPDEITIDGEGQEGAGALRHLTVYATHGARALAAGDPGVEELRDYWANVSFVRSTGETAVSR
jgi:hypothetical protein